MLSDFALPLHSRALVLEWGSCSSLTRPSPGSHPSGVKPDAASRGRSLPELHEIGACEWSVGEELQPTRRIDHLQNRSFFSRKPVVLVPLRNPRNEERGRSAATSTGVSSETSIAIAAGRQRVPGVLLPIPRILPADHRRTAADPSHLAAALRRSATDPRHPAHRSLAHCSR